MAKVTRKPHRVRKKHSIWKNKFFRLCLLLSILLISIFYCLVFFPFFQIKEIKILGNDKVSAQQVKDIIEQRIKKDMLWFSTKSIFLADLSAIEKTLSQRFYYIDKVELKRELLTGLEAKIEERIPVALWCTRDCYLIDKQGIQLEKTSPASTTLSLIIKSQDPPEKDRISAILEINKKIDVKEFVILPERLTAKMGQGWEIYFDLEEDILQQLFNLEVLLEKQIPAQEQKNIQYIDLRFGNTIYYLPK